MTAWRGRKLPSCPWHSNKQVDERLRPDLWGSRLLLRQGPEQSVDLRFFTDSLCAPSPHLLILSPSLQPSGADPWMHLSVSRGSFENDRPTDWTVCLSEWWLSLNKMKNLFLDDSQAQRDWEPLIWARWVGLLTLVSRCLPSTFPTSLYLRWTLAVTSPASHF
jgi:hypothetical protein